MKLFKVKKVNLDKEESIYSKKFRINLLENDEISPEEEAFMAGYMEEE